MPWMPSYPNIVDASGTELPPSLPTSQLDRGQLGARKGGWQPRVRGLLVAISRLAAVVLLLIKAINGESKFVVASQFTDVDKRLPMVNTDFAKVTRPLLTVNLVEDFVGWPACGSWRLAGFGATSWRGFCRIEAGNKNPAFGVLLLPPF